MNWNALTALATFGLFIIAAFSFFNPNLDQKISLTLFIIFILLLLLILRHKLFRLVRRGTGGAVYKVRWGIKHWIENPTTLRRLGNTWDDIENISDWEFHLHPTGRSINLARRQL